jgi:hypothetical protein
MPRSCSSFAIRSAEHVAHQTDVLPAVHRTIELAIHRKVRALVGVFFRQFLVDIDPEARLVPRVERAIREGICVRKLVAFAWRMYSCTRSCGR